MMKPKVWVIAFSVLIAVPLGFAGLWTYKVDPYFHYHKPDTEDYLYTVDNERSQNDGISRNFDYQGLITGTSMTENFKASEAEALFGGTFIKVPFSGGSYKEINDNVEVALKHNKELKTVIRCLDMSFFIMDKDWMRNDLGEYPTYLYDENPFNDVEYLFNRGVLFSIVYPMTRANDAEGFQGGITSFDSYANWMAYFTFGVNTLCPNGPARQHAGAPQQGLTDGERETILGSVEQNITSLAKQYPDVDFYYFFPPYSGNYWQSIVDAGTFDKQIEAERLIIREILKVNNIRLFSFNNLTGITMDLNHYQDANHYAEWINSLMLKYMHDGKCRLTLDNYEGYLAEEKSFYKSVDYYKEFSTQEDYERDYYAAALLNEEINGVKPYHFEKSDIEKLRFNNAGIVKDGHGGNVGILCRGSLKRESESEIPISKYVKGGDYCGFKIEAYDVSDYKYFVFYGKKIKDHGQPYVCICNGRGTVLAETAASYQDLDDKWHMYLIDVSQIDGKVDIIFHGGYVNQTGAEASKYVFSDFSFY